jgi:hypothetical protein
MNELLRFSDFANEPTCLEGCKVKIDDILNQEIIISGHSIKSSKYSKNESGKYLTLQFMYPSENAYKIFFSGSDVLITQIEKYADKIPFMAVIKKVNRYYTLT